MDFLKRIKDTVLAAVPEECKIAEVAMEGPEVAIYTRNPKAFFDNENYVAKIAYELKKRVVIRTDKSLLMDEDKAKEKITAIVPADAGIQSIEFSPGFSQVTIVAMKPGLVIGKGGETSKRITIETGWVPEILRAPTASSPTLAGVRNQLQKYSQERKKILEEFAEKIYGREEIKLPNGGWLRLTALGGFRQVGRSCLFLETNKTKVLMDCGVNVASHDEQYPYLEAMRFPVNELDAVIITHSHIDHMGFVPYLFKLGYRGPVYVTPPTRDLMALLQMDFVDVAAKEGKEPPFTERDVKEMLKYCVTREYKEVTDIAPDMRLTFHNAAHILGSSTAHMHIGDGAHNLVYTGDIKYGFTRLFDPVDNKFPRLETLVIESTYGGKDDILPQRQEAEDRLLQIINETVERGGNVLIPVFAVGRSQEIQLVLENYYRRGLLNAKIYIDGLCKEASAIHTAYPEYLRESVQRRILQNDSPFTSDFVKDADAQSRDTIVGTPGNIIMASSGMLTGGSSVDYFYRMAEDPKNTLVFVGWQGESSLGRRLQSGLRSLPVPAGNGKTRELKVNMRVETVEGFSGHSDRLQLVNYIRSLKPMPKRVLVNHGDRNNTLEFSRYVTNRFRINANAMRNLDTLRLR